MHIKVALEVVIRLSHSTDRTKKKQAHRITTANKARASSAAFGAAAAVLLPCTSRFVAVV